MGNGGGPRAVIKGFSSRRHSAVYIAAIGAKESADDLSGGWIYRFQLRLISRHMEHSI